MTDNIATSNHDQGSSQATQSAPRPITSRYKDAYAMAHTLNGFGTLLKICGVVLLALAILAGMFAAKKTGLELAPEMGYVSFWAGIAVGVVLFLPIYIAGILFGALGQILRASLDTAVNTSPLLTKEEMKTMMSLD